MSASSFAYIANYLWQRSMENIDAVLTAPERRRFSIADYYYLTTIYYMNRPNFGEVAERFGITKPAISAMVRRLESIGFVERQQSAEDRRIYYLEVTEKGRRIVEGDNGLYLQFLDLMRGLTTPEQMEQVDSLLEQVADALKKDARQIHMSGKDL